MPAAPLILNPIIPTPPPSLSKCYVFQQWIKNWHNNNWPLAFIRCGFPVYVRGSFAHYYLIFNVILHQKKSENQIFTEETDRERAKTEKH